MKVEVTIAHGDEKIVSILGVPTPADISPEANMKRVRRRVNAIQKAHPRATVTWRYVEDRTE